LVKKTVIFESRFGVDINQFSSTQEIDEFLEKKLGRKLRVVRLDQGVVDDTGNVFMLSDYDIDRIIDEELKD